MDDDDFDLTMEEMDALEKEALERINQNKVPNLSQGSRSLPSSLAPKPNTASAPKGEGVKVPVKILLHHSGDLAAKFPYNQSVVDAVRKIPMALWNAKERLWIFPQSSLSSAENILRQVSSVKVEVENLDPLVQRAIASASRVPDLRHLYDKIPSHIEPKLLPFQRDGIEFILQHGGRVLLADEMGLGKTLQASNCCDYMRSRILASSDYCTIFLTFTLGNVLPQPGGSNKCGFTIVSSNTKGTIHLDGVFNIISYDVVTKLDKLLMALDFKVVIADESHFLKNAQAKRTTATLPVIKKAQYAILLSGTPALSRPIELFKQLEALYPDVYRNVHEYGSRYCKGGVFGIYQGASNHEELHNLMKATVMIRRLKKDVLSELPSKRRQQVFLDLAEKDMKQINALFRELKVVKAKIKDCMSEDDIKSLKFTEKQLINKIYTDSAEAKIPAVTDYLGTVLEAGCKFLVFAHHQSMLEALHQFLKKKKVGCIRIDGSTPASSRQALVSDFQGNDEIKAAVLSIRAAGVGITLTAASTVIFAELAWTPGDLIQAEDRAHRIGQVSSVNIHYLLANDTVDDIIWDVVQSKLENLGQTRQVSVAAYIIGWSMPRSPDAGRARMLNFAPNGQQDSNPSVESKGILSPDSNRIMAFGNRIHDFVVPGRKIFWLSALDVGTAGT
uniref:SWI/SNF-related matrix-associated actin-dependent regulator of chromatin subfamily A-like protein 1 n=1 Tax=Brassica campestris TaxID=3711 RepID=M4ETW5_BRACM